MRPTTVVGPTYAGIDFGTSNTTAAIIENGAPRLIPLEGDRVTLPSALFFSLGSGEIAVGRAALNLYAEGADGRLMRALKSVLGSGLIAEKTRVGKRLLRFDQIIGLFIGALKARLAAQKIEPSDLVMGRPVRFVDDDDAADARAQAELEAAVREHGFRHVEFQYEPIAAALDYERQVAGEELALIADIGGGTSDFSIVRLSPQRANAADRKNDILANGGVHVGGTDFDRLISIAFVMPELGYLTPTRDGKRNLPAGYFIDLATWHRIHRLYTSKALIDLKQIRYEAARPDLVDRMIEVVENRYGHALAAKVETAKIELSDHIHASVRVDLPDVHFEARLERNAINEVIASGVERIGAALLDTVKSAGISPTDITSVFLTGGSTSLPAVRRAILKCVPSARVVDGDVFGSVGLGLALDAARKFS